MKKTEEVGESQIRKSTLENRHQEIDTNMNADKLQNVDGRKCKCENKAKRSKYKCVKTQRVDTKINANISAEKKIIVSTVPTGLTNTSFIR